MIRGVSERDDPAQCSECQVLADRKFSPIVYFNNTSVENAEYNPGLGQVVKNRHHKKELCKKLGVQEVGNDFKSSKTMQTHYDTVREDKLEKRWEDE
jgi:hypothetical protein